MSGPEKASRFSSPPPPQKKKQEHPCWLSFTQGFSSRPILNTLGYSERDICGTTMAMPRRTIANHSAKHKIVSPWSSVAPVLAPPKCNRHQSLIRIFLIQAGSALRLVSRRGFQCRYKSLGYRIGPSRRAARPARQAQPHTQVLVIQAQISTRHMSPPSRRRRQAESCIRADAGFERGQGPDTAAQHSG